MPELQGGSRFRYCGPQIRHQVTELLWSWRDACSSCGTVFAIVSITNSWVGGWDILQAAVPGPMTG